MLLRHTDTINNNNADILASPQPNWLLCDGLPEHLQFAGCLLQRDEQGNFCLDFYINVCLKAGLTNISHIKVIICISLRTWIWLNKVPNLLVGRGIKLEILPILKNNCMQPSLLLHCWFHISYFLFSWSSFVMKFNLSGWKYQIQLNNELYNVMKKLETQHSDTTFIIKGLHRWVRLTWAAEQASHCIMNIHEPVHCVTVGR